MFATSLIVFREVLEAALIVSLVMVASRGIRGRGRWVGGGLVAGVVFASLLALLAGRISEAAEGMGQEILNAVILFAAVFMLGWHNVWMRKHGAELGQRMKQVGRAVMAGERPLWVLAVVVGLATMREGAEIVLFLHGIAATGSGAGPMMAGGAIGLAAGAALGAALYLGLLRIPARHVFTVSGGLILLLAAGMASQGAAYLVQADLLPPLGQIWDTSAFLSEQSLPGQLLHTLVGYDSRPMGIQLVFYGLTLLSIALLMRWVGGRDAPLRVASSTAIAAVALSVVLAASPEPVLATHKVYSPTVEKGEVELEARGHLTRDSDKVKDDQRKDRYEIGYGLTDWWFTSIFAEYESERGTNYEWEATAWENVFQLTEEGKYWLDVGLYAEYEWAREKKNPDKVELKALFEKEVGPTVHTANLIFEREVGSNSEDEIEFGYAWRSKWRWIPQLEPAIEVFGVMGELGRFEKAKNQEHSIGPVAMGEFRLGPGKLVYELGYLYGLTGATPDGIFKWLIEYEFRF